MTQCSISNLVSSGARGVCAIFSLDSATKNCILCALFDVAAVIRRQLSTILLETCIYPHLPYHSPSPSLSLSLFVVSLALM